MVGHPPTFFLVQIIDQLDPALRQWLMVDLVKVHVKRFAKLLQDRGLSVHALARSVVAWLHPSDYLLLGSRHPGGRRGAISAHVHC